MQKPGCFQLPYFNAKWCQFPVTVLLLYTIGTLVEKCSHCCFFLLCQSHFCWCSAQGRKATTCLLAFALWERWVRMSGSVIIIAIWPNYGFRAAWAAELSQEREREREQGVSEWVCEQTRTRWAFFGRIVFRATGSSITVVQWKRKKQHHHILMRKFPFFHVFCLKLHKVGSSRQFLKRNLESLLLQYEKWRTQCR